VLFDTDVLIFAQQGSASAKAAILKADERHISLQTLLELLQTNRGKAEHRLIKSFLRDLGFTVLPLTENIGHRAAVYMEEYGPGTGLQAGDAIIAASAVEHALPMTSGNAKHFKAIKELSFTALKVGKGL
jgi:predicted nucleic acid-binding protein